MHVVVKDGFQPPVGSVVDVLATYDPSLATGGRHRPGRAPSSRAAPGSWRSPARHERGDRRRPPTTDTAGSGVTLLVTEAEARAVAYAASIGEVSLALAPAQARAVPPPRQ